MREGLIEELLRAALSRRRAARRWSAILLVLAAWLHLQVLAPFADASAEHARIEERLAAARGELGAFERAAASIAAAQRASAQALGELTQTFVAELRAGFAELQAARTLLQARPGLQPAAPGAGPPFPPFPPFPSFPPMLGLPPAPWTSNLPAPAGPPPSPVRAPLGLPAMPPGPPPPSPVQEAAPQRFPPMPPEPGPVALAALEDAEVRVALEQPDPMAARSALRPFVERRIVAPAYERLNEDFRSRVAGPLREAVALLRAQPAAGPALELVDELLQLADRRLEPPADPFWWASVEGKGGAGSLAALTYERASDALGQSRDLVARLVERGVQEQSARLEAHKARLKALQEQLDRQIAALGELARPLGAVRLELAGLLGWAPAALGLLLASLLVWHADAGRELALLAGWLASRLPAEDPDRPWLQRWLGGAATGRLERLLPLVGAMAGAAWILALARGLAPAGDPWLPWGSGLGLALLLAGAATAGRSAPAPDSRRPSDA